jgi:putative spermidine/putrescine transport system ATP-binding protein
MPTIELKGISKRFGKVVAAEGINLRVENREYVTILGPSGCGKTTLVKVISGIWEPTEGRVFIDGKDVTNIPIYERDLGYVFQNIALFPHMNIKQNVNYGPIVKDWDREKGERISKEMMELVDLLGKAEFLPRELSSGEQQKAGIARALCSGAKLLILDEPLSALDARIRLDLRYEIKRLVKRLGLTAVHVTHDQEEAMSISDRIVLMRAGRIVEVDKPENLYNRPKNLFTANFVGEASFIEGSVSKCDGEFCTAEARHGNHLRILNRETLFKAGDAIVVMARPEGLFISRENAENALPGKIEDVIFMGSFLRYRVVLATDDKVLVDVPEATGTRFNKGENVNVLFKPFNLSVYTRPKEGLTEVLKLE